MTPFLPTSAETPAQTCPPPASLPARWLGPGALLAVLLGGLYLVPLRAMGPRLADAPGDLGDGRFNNYVLEHGWLVLTGRQPRFWDAPFFYPEPGVIAWSDCHLGTLPFYAIFRAAGCDRETAYQGWFLTLCVLNYLAAAWTLRRLGASWLGAAAGACVFAFCMPVAVQMGHPQLYPRFLVPLALYFAYRVCAGDGLRCWMGLGVSIVWQMYATLYNGYFLLLLLAFFLPACVLLRWRAALGCWVAQHGWWPPAFHACLLALAFYALPMQRRLALAVAVLTLADVCRYWRGLLWKFVCGGGWRPCLARAAVVGVCVAATLPLMRPYLSVSRDHRRPLEEVMNLTPRVHSWLSAPGTSLLWSSLNRNAAKVPMAHEQYLFPGAIPAAALLAALACAFATRHGECRGFAAAGALAFAGVFVLTLHTRSFCLYTFFYALPGVHAFRAVARVGLVLVFPAAAALAYWLTAGQAWLTRRTSPTVAATAVSLLLLPIAADQALRRPGLLTVSKTLCQERALRVAEQVRSQDPRARLFLHLGDHPDPVIADLDAMMASQDLGIPTLNGYSGWAPRDYELLRKGQDVEHWEQAVRRRLGDDLLRRRVPGYAQGGFDGLVVVGRMRAVREQSGIAAGPHVAPRVRPRSGRTARPATAGSHSLPPTICQFTWTMHVEADVKGQATIPTVPQMDGDLPSGYNHGW
jgi:hypothetical protein